MAFNPNEHMLDMRGKKYLPVVWRIVWFREVYPGGKISTEIVNMEPLCVKAYIITADGTMLASGHGTANDTGKAVWSGRAIEKAETAAIGRALGHAGFGTQFDADDEDDNLADSPVEQKKQNPYSAAPATQKVTEPKSKATHVAIKKDNDSSPYLIVRNGDTPLATANSRKVFTEAGYDTSLWTEIGSVIELDPPAIITTQIVSNTTVVTSVTKAA